VKRIAALVAVTLAAAAAPAWEDDTTHAGLTEQAALASRLHARLQAFFARRGGWLEPLRLAPERAKALYAKLALLEPSSGVVPDRAGRQSALSWLLAGSVVEGMPAAREQNHFYDPIAKRGLRGSDSAPLTLFIQTGISAVGGAGVPAPDWIVAKENDLGVARFWLELERSVVAPGPAERDEHLAMAFVSAGAMLHVLEDMGAPARTRGDLDEFLLPLGGGPRDRGSRFERLAALVFGRLGVPPAGPAVERKGLRDYFTAADGQGLADLTNATWYSSGTLPADVIVPVSARSHPGEIAGLIAKASRYPAPRPGKDLPLAGDSASPDGLVVRGEDGVCRANYRIDDGTIHFSISDDCAAAQLRAILPQVGGYAAGFLEHLFRGGLAVIVESGTARVSVPKSELQLGAGQLTFVVEDATGQRKVVGTGELRDGTANLNVPADAARVFVVFRGVDSNGESLIAVGSGAAK